MSTLTNSIKPKLYDDTFKLQLSVSLAVICTLAIASLISTYSYISQM